MDIQVKSQSKFSDYRRVFHNRAWLLIWSGQSVSTVGDAFFNLAVMWVVYIQTGSALQTAIIQVVWHLSSTLLGPFAGIWADRGNRKHILILTNALSAAVVGIVAALLFTHGSISPLLVFLAIFLLNSLNTFSAPTTFSIMPELVGKELLTTASGLLSSAEQGAFFLGSALAGVTIAIAGAGWAVMIDAFSFLCAAFSIAAAKLPGRAKDTTSSTAEKRPTFLHEVIDGWRVIIDQPVTRVLVALVVLINVASFMGPLMPALVHLRLQGGAGAYSFLEAMGIIGGIVGGVLAGTLERQIGVGRLLALGWSLAGVCVLGIAVSTSLPLTAALETVVAFGLTAGSVSINALLQTLLPENYRGRVFALMTGMAVIAIPLSALLGGWLADLLGPAPLFAIAGVWILGIAVLTWSNLHIRAAQIAQGQ